MTEDNKTPSPSHYTREPDMNSIAAQIRSLTLHPTASEEYDAGYIAARNDAFAIVQEAIDNA